MNIKAYLNRINYSGHLIPDLEVLKSLQKNHLLSVPFENLDIHYNKTINLDVEKFYHKIVEEKRGGFCYELNGLFNTLLNALGYNSRIISARAYDIKRDDFGKEFDHMAMIVELNQAEYLVDAGFGEFVFSSAAIGNGHSSNRSQRRFYN
jgi:N-hydroxyarylamine O-acetyltransferase